MPLKKKILIIEPSFNGHRGPYVMWLSKGFAERGYEVVIITHRESKNHPLLANWDNYKSTNSGGTVDIFWCENELANSVINIGSSLIYAQYNYWKYFKVCYDEYCLHSKPDAVFIPYLDYCVYAIGILGSPFGSSKWSGIVMRPSFHFVDMEIISQDVKCRQLKRYLFLKVLKNKFLSKLFSIDESLVEYFRNNVDSLHNIKLLPEPIGFDIVPDREDARRLLKLPNNTKSLLVYGSITNRKGIEQILNALLDEKFPKNVDLILAGRLHNEVLFLMNEKNIQKLIKSKRVHVFNRFIEQEEEALFFGAADIVWLGYINHFGPSGVLIQAESAGKPIIACREGYIGWKVKKNDLGVVVDLRKKEMIIDGVLKVLSFGRVVSKASDDKFKSDTFANAFDILEDSLFC